MPQITDTQWEYVKDLELYFVDYAYSLLYADTSITQFQI